MDQDIADAVDSLALDKIKTQDWRDSEAVRYQMLTEESERRIALQTDQRNMLQSSVQVAAELDDPMVEKKLMLALALAPIFVKPNTATLPESIATYANACAARYDAGLRAAWAKLQVFLSETA